MQAFPDAPVAGFDSLVDGLELPDPDDRHVLAAAVHGECDLLVTYNVKDFPESAVQRFDVLVLTVDDALVLLAGWFQGQMAAVVDRQIAALHRPSMSREAFLKRLASRAPMGAMTIGAALGIESYTLIFQDVLDIESETSPQGAVRRLLFAVEGGRAHELSELVDPVLAMRLTGLRQPSPGELCARLQVALEDVRTSEGWGFASGKRLHGPEIETREVSTPRQRSAHRLRASGGTGSHLLSARAGQRLGPRSPRRS